MTPDDLHDVMDLLGAYWPGTLSSTELLAWRRNLRHLDVEPLVEALDGLAASGRRFRPSVGLVVESYRARVRARHCAEAPPPVVANPLPLSLTRRYLDDAWAALGPVSRHARSRAS
jgi:hypothetical protein